jgi:preprotein translocase subunit SecA
MNIAHRGRSIARPLVSPAMPYAENTDRRSNRLDRALLNIWGRVSSHLLSSAGYGRRRRIVECVEAVASELALLSDQQLRQAADELRSRLISAGFDLQGTASAFAIAREAARRHTDMCHFEVQLLGGAAMMGGAVAEMQTGEGKSLTALLPAVAAALSGRPVHIVTVNDYLARRDAELFRSVYGALGLSAGLVEHGQSPRERQRAYACDVTYCANKELVFDYLRDRIALGARRSRPRRLVHELFKTDTGHAPAMLLRGLHFALVDEADSVLVDEARTPLILSGTEGDTENDAELYQAALDFARRLVRGDHYHVLPNEKTIRLTGAGERRVAELAAQGSARSLGRYRRQVGRR